MNKALAKQYDILFVADVQTVNGGRDDYETFISWVGYGYEYAHLSVGQFVDGNRGAFVMLL